MTGASGGLTFGIMFAMYGLGFWYGVKLIMDDRESEACRACPPPDFDCLTTCVRYNAKALLTVFFSVLIGGFQLGQAAPYVEAGLATKKPTQKNPKKLSFLYKRNSKVCTQLKVHKIENFFDSDFGICVISLIVMSKY